MKFKIGDLVRIQDRFADPSGKEFDWIGMILSYEGRSDLGDEPEWIVQWAHAIDPAHEYGYYLEAICE